MTSPSDKTGKRDAVSWVKDITVFLSALALVGGVWTLGRSVPTKDDVDKQIESLSTGLKEAITLQGETLTRMMNAGFEKAVLAAKEEVLNNHEDPRFPFNQARDQLDERARRFDERIDGLIATNETMSRILDKHHDAQMETTHQIELLRKAQTGTHTKIDKNAAQIETLASRFHLHFIDKEGDGDL